MEKESCWIFSEMLQGYSGCFSPEEYARFARAANLAAQKLLTAKVSGLAELDPDRRCDILAKYK